ncbi:MAG: hypothetical protein H6502_02940 [Candidatus Woesearchaeota archaeon]|nr:MAG: hypothetical protein H6502_02940 [Candidatus Woesearchaeota archaeon]
MNSLHSWTEQYARFKMIHEPGEQSLTNRGETIVVKTGKGVREYVVMEELRLPEKLTEKTVLVTKNSKANFDFFLKHFDAFAELADVIMVFVHVATNTYWLINPRLHKRFSDPAMRKESLKNMFVEVAHEN